MHDAEETGLNSALFDALRLFKENRVFHYFGLTWNDMKLLTHEEFTYIMELSASSAKKEHDKTQQSLNDLNSQIQKK